MNRLRRRTIRAAVATVGLALLVTLGGCLDVVQYISGTGEEIEVFFRLTLQKSVFELASSMGDEPQNLDEMFEQEFNLNEEEVLGELPPGVEASFSQVNTDSEFGFVLEYSALREVLDTVPESGASFVPRITPRGMTIPLSEGDAGEGSDQFSEAFLGSSKYRIMISKLLVSRISKARVLTSERSVPISVTELPDIWLLEFPMSLWFANAGTPTVEIIF